MTNQLLIYQTAVPVSHARHAGAAIRPGATYGFSAQINSVPVMTVEFPHLTSECAIVFAGSKGQVLPAVMLGLRDQQNLFVAADGQWQGRYVPAFLRRYPFVFAQESDRFVLCVDELFPGFNQDGDGQRLFAEDGRPSTYVEGVLAFMQDYQVQFLRTQAFCARLEELGLLEPMQAEVTEPSGTRTSMRGFQAVSRARLKALPGSALAELMDADQLELLFLHLQSMRNFEALRDRMARTPRPSADETETEPSLV